MTTAKFDIIKFFDDFRIPYITEGHKHCRAGNVQVPCPFCTGNPGWHLGYHLEKGVWNCWRCGGHSHRDVIKALLKEHHHLDPNSRRFWRVLQVYRRQSPTKPVMIEKEEPHVEFTALPSFSVSPLPNPHRDYLIKRYFDPDLLERTYNLHGTGPIGSYRFRIIAPIYLKGKLISYQGRDITGKSDLKYKACRLDKEVIHHKNSLYAIDNAKTKTCVIVEGITDVWRLGPGAVGTYGIKFTMAQTEMIRKNFNRSFILYDSGKCDPEADAQAERMLRNLSQFMPCELLCLDDGDPADLSQDDANYLMKDLLRL